VKAVWRALLSLGVFAVVVTLEKNRPLRASKESKLRRNARNLAMASLSAVVIQSLESPVVRPLAKAVALRRWGLLKRFPVPRAAETALAALLMDYTLYLWHIAAHRVPMLWRFHAVHHVDLDLDASTALRFHFGELALSVPFRAVQVLLIGVDTVSLTAWQTALSLSILFHHSNVRLPARAERVLALFFVTPGMHGIHHSRNPRESNCNWSSGLSLWDIVHGTFRLDIPQDRIAVGVAGLDSPRQVTLPRIIALPLGHESAVEQFRRDSPPLQLLGRRPQAGS
jgi:sterol desaturase/sphingolipid hydroxylase (fatty acid hydroxylase superfamily)